MTSHHSRGLHHVPRKRALAWAVALAIGASTCGAAEAARLGHARVVSAPGAPLQAVVPLLELAPEEAANLQVGLADAAAWQRAGLQPPTPLADTTVRVEPGADASSRVVRIVSGQPPAADTVDLLLDLRSSAGQRQLQVTILMPPRGGAAPVRRATVGQPAAPAAAATQQVQVRPGQTLSGIAVRHAVADATLYQMLAALWQANPQAFIQNNMNLVRAGETLTIPDAATVRAIDPAEARRLFVEQAEAYARYRAGLGAAAGASTAPRGAEGVAGRVESGPSSRAAASASPQDRLRLSNAAAGGGADAQAEASADARTSDNRAMDDARQRVDTLQSNVDALNRAGSEAGGAGAQGAANGAAGQASGAGQGNGAQGAGGAASGGAGQAAGQAGAASAGAGGNGTSGASGPAANGAASGAAGGAADAAAQGGSAAPGAAGSSSPAAGVSNGGSAGATPGGQGAASSGTASGAPGTSSPQAAANGASPADGAAGERDGMPGWLADNLLAIVTVVLALVIFVVAWMLRRAGARRSEDEEPYDYSEPAVPALDHTALNRKLDTINLDLDQPPPDEPSYGRRT